MNRGTSDNGAKPQGANAYVAPAIEQLLTPDDLEREIHYAGGLTCPTCDRNNL